MASRRANVTIKVNTFWPIVLTGMLVLTQLAFPSRVWIALLWMVGGLTTLAYYWVRQIARHLASERVLRFGWVQVGDRMEERFTLINDSWMPVLWAEVVDESDLPGYEARRVATCDGNSSARWTLDKVCTRRGLYTLGPWSLWTGDPFGFFSVVFRHEDRRAIIVYPPVVHLPEIALPRGLFAGQSRARRRATEATIDASQTRLYQPHDPLRLIHWPSTAHRGTLIVRDPDTEISGDLWIILDLDRHVQAGEDQESTEEYGVILAASLADLTLRQNRGVGLVAQGEELVFVPPRRGRGHMWNILQALATAKAGGTQRLVEVLHHMRENLSRGATVLAITPSCEPDWADALLALTHRGIAPAVVLLDPASFDPLWPGSLGEEGKETMQGMRALLADAGIAVHVIHKGYPFRYAVPPKRRGYWEFKTSPLGRAIAVRRPEGS